MMLEVCRRDIPNRQYKYDNVRIFKLTLGLSPVHGFHPTLSCVTSRTFFVPAFAYYCIDYLTLDTAS